MMELLRGELTELFGEMSSAELSEKNVNNTICDEAGEMAQNGTGGCIIASKKRRTA